MTYWIGRIEPSMWFEGQWWQEILPDDVRLAVLSLGVQRLVDEDLERAHAAILEKVEMLDREGVDVINVGGSPVVSVHGRAGHERLINDIAAITRRPFVTSLQAEVEGLRDAGAGKVLIASPYPIKQTEKRVTVLTEEGFEVIAHESLDIERTRDIAQLDPQRVLSQAVDLASGHRRDRRDRAADGDAGRHERPGPDRGESPADRLSPAAVRLRAAARAHRRSSLITGYDIADQARDDVGRIGVQEVRACHRLDPHIGKEIRIGELVAPAILGLTIGHEEEDRAVDPRQVRSDAVLRLPRSAKPVHGSGRQPSHH